MISKVEIKKWILENCVNENRNIDLSGLDFSDFEGDIYINNWKVKWNLYQDNQEAGEDLFQYNQKVGRDLYQDFQNVKGKLYK